MTGSAETTQRTPTFAGYVARPEGTGPWPGVVLLHEMFGVDDSVRALADRLAAAGYLTAAPNLFDQGVVQGFAQVIGSIVSGQGAARTHVESARQWLLDQEDCVGRVGIVGLSMGGSLALRCLADGYDAASVVYPVQLFSLEALEGGCPVAVSLGGTDPTALGAVARFESALSERSIPHDVKSYPGAGHSYLNARFDRLGPLRQLLRVMHQGPQADAAEDTWRRTESFLASHLAHAGQAVSTPSV